MKYTIEDTDTGYRLTAHGATADYIVEERGGHGLIERLYADVSDTWLEALQNARNSHYPSTTVQRRETNAERGRRVMREAHTGRREGQ